MNNVTLIFGIIFLAITTALGPAQSTSTVEERGQWVEITHKLETNPLDQELDKQGESAVNRLSEVHDVHVALCPPFLFEFNEMKYLYAHALRRQFMLASAAFVIENRDKSGSGKADGHIEQNLAAVESVLKMYSSILQQKPEPRHKLLDNLLDQQRGGKLAGYVRKRCP